MLKALLILPLAMLSGCATLVTGTDQTVTVSTTPAGAACTLDRMGSRVGAISTTPGSVRIDKSRHDLSVTCVKEGYQTATVSHSSSFNGATFGNIIAGGVIGVVVDAASGANFTYPNDIRMQIAANPLPIVPPVALQSAPEDVSYTPVSVRPDRRSARVQPISANATNRVGPSGLYPR